MPRARTVHAANETRSSHVEFKPIRHNVIQLDQRAQEAGAKPAIVFSTVTPRAHLQDRRAPKFDSLF